jgi:uncharacterized DUF497 family protein
VNLNGIRAKLRAIAAGTGLRSRKRQPYLAILSVTYVDPDHSETEQRFVTVGLSKSRRVLIVAHVDQKERIRIISARRTTRLEPEEYEQKD